MTNNPRTIILEVGQWAERQPWHPKHAPDFGVLEEFGELMHAILKHYQSIRGFDDQQFYQLAVKDALGDMMVYLSHWCYLNDAYYILQPCKVEQSYDDLHPHLVQILISLTQMVNHKSGVAQSIAIRLANTIQVLACTLGFDLMKDCLIPTWEKVKQRDWNKNKLTQDA